MTNGFAVGETVFHKSFGKGRVQSFAHHSGGYWVDFEKNGGLRPILPFALFRTKAEAAAFKPSSHREPAIKPKTAQPKSVHEPVFLNAASLFAMEFPPIKYVVPGYVAEGMTLLAGRPKLGKSWLVLEMALAVASGGICLGGVECEQGDVLYLALEDNPRRLQSRLKRLWQLETLAKQPIPDRLTFVTEWPRAGNGGIEQLRTWIAGHREARLIIVDVLAMFRPMSKGRDQTLYDADYHAIKELQALASEAGVAIIVVHHARKGASESGDPFEVISGTLGLSGAADTAIVLNRDSNGTTLAGRGRDIEEFETAVIFDRMTCKWNALGAADDVRRTDERSVILDALRDSGEPMSPAEIADALGLQRNNVRQLIFKMVKAGELVKAQRGRYAHPDHASYQDEDPTPDNSDNSDNKWYDQN